MISERYNFHSLVVHPQLLVLLGHLIVQLVDLHPCSSDIHLDASVPCTHLVIVLSLVRVKFVHFSFFHLFKAPELLFYLSNLFLLLFPINEGLVKMVPIVPVLVVDDFRLHFFWLCTCPLFVKSEIVIGQGTLQLPYLFAEVIELPFELGVKIVVLLDFGNVAFEFIDFVD